MINYIGDISKEDASLLCFEVHSAKNILEFGCGASTQVIASCIDKDAKFISIDTESGWIEKTRGILGMMQLEHKVDFALYYEYMASSKGEFDFIFNDGVDQLRRQFGIQIWPHLKVGGIMGFHDTRRGHDMRNVLEVIAHYQDEVEAANFNFIGSNITLLRKKAPEPYVNWQISEGKEPWQLGYGELPEEFVNKYKPSV